MAKPTPPPDKPAAKPATPATKPAASTKPAPGAKPGAAAAKPSAAKPGAARPAPPAEPAAPTMKAEIRARLRKGTPARFEIPPAGAVLGRDATAAVSIPLDGVSREHARVQWDGRG